MPDAHAALAERLRVKPNQRVRLNAIDPRDTLDLPDKDESKEMLEKNSGRISELQEVLYAENRRALLVVLQALDAGGKDSTIRHVMSGENPQGCQVFSF